MKIVILCGVLEPGKCGGGDYSRNLAGELISQGHEVAICALMDSFVGTNSIIEEVQQTNQNKVSVIRLPYLNGYEANSKIALEWINAFNPDWISLQYGPFAFHPKGLPFGLSKAIKKISEGRKLHIMFHELWVGMNTEASIKLKIWGKVQKGMIASFINALNPSLIQTQTKLYQHQLRRIGSKASILPLFSNIKVAPFHKKTEQQNNLRFVLFGAIHPEAPVEKFAYSVSRYATRNKLEIEIIFIGRSGNELQNWMNVCQLEGIKTIVMGEQPSSIISEVLQSATLGISTTPILIAEKSGTIAAMHQHGLSVLCVCRAWTVKGFSKKYLPFKVQLFKGDGLSQYLSPKNKGGSINTVTSVANQFIDSLIKLK